MNPIERLADTRLGYAVILIAAVVGFYFFADWLASIFPHPRSALIPPEWVVYGSTAFLAYAAARAWWNDR
ncbi:hypothetical protein [Reyranella sp. CPCC 100927]|uniref:hypothetical protein n=1 Tax=Reyranella sp. CPCC 100927 TaxID=2599616 RepID=UPI0011B6A0CD|nr:hypothetical protein [Reyranella sp. CPCC 100927]TWS94988.1 hypothetical protein FQU96_40785 [Reyranella sp. CPCC 100927]